MDVNLFQNCLGFPLLVRVDGVDYILPASYPVVRLKKFVPVAKDRLLEGVPCSQAPYRRAIDLPLEEFIAFESNAIRRRPLRWRKYRVVSARVLLAHSPVERSDKQLIAPDYPGGGVYNDLGQLIGVSRFLT